MSSHMFYCEVGHIVWELSAFSFIQQVWIHDYHFSHFGD